MQIVMLVLNKTEKLEELLEAFLEEGIRGCTVLESTGMMRVLNQNGDDMPMFGALRALFDPERKSSKTLMMVLNDQEVETVKKVIRKVVGDLSKPDTGILFAMPALFVEGLAK